MSITVSKKVFDLQSNCFVNFIFKFINIFLHYVFTFVNTVEIWVKKEDLRK